MKVSHTWLQRYFDVKIPSAEELEELLSLHSSEVEEIEELMNS